MKTIIHDLLDSDLKRFVFNKEDAVYNSLECKNYCCGCFSCWTKHPCKCMYDDGFSQVSYSLKESDELVLITKNTFGSYSKKVKQVLERCLGYVLPYFEEREGLIHHKSRFANKIKLSVYIYGEIAESEKESLISLVKANSINLNAQNYEVHFLKNVKEMSKCLH